MGQNLIVERGLGKNKMGRGRPHKSQIRQNLVEMLYFLHEGYGYELFKHYRLLFSPVTMRVIYYHLRTGKNLGEFKVNKINYIMLL